MNTDPVTTTPCECARSQRLLNALKSIAAKNCGSKPRLAEMIADIRRIAREAIIADGGSVLPVQSSDLSEINRHIEELIRLNAPHAGPLSEAYEVRKAIITRDTSPP